MQSLRVVSSSTLRTAFGRGVALLSVSCPVMVAACDSPKPTIVVKDDAGNINWNKTLSRIPEAAFWDDLAKVTGQGVSK